MVTYHLIGILVCLSLTIEDNQEGLIRTNHNMESFRRALLDSYSSQVYRRKVWTSDANADRMDRLSVDK